jgi:hypothetical protein
MSYLTYERFKNLHKNVAPYRGTNQIPYADRTHRHKFFSPVEVNGEIEYHLSYYWEWEREFMDMAEFEQAKEHMGKRLLNSWHQSSPDYCDGQSYYYKYYRDIKPYGILRSDNTLEIVSDNMHQGLRMHLSDNLSRGAYVMRDCNSGGSIITDSWREARRQLKLPIFKGMRFSIDTLEMHESSRYIIDVKRVDRKKSNEVLKSYKDSFTLMNTFYKSMDKDAFTSELKETAKEYLLDEDNQYIRPSVNRAHKIGAEMFKDNPMLASYLTILSGGYGNARWVAKMSSDSLYYDVPWYARRAENDLRLNLKYRHDTFTRLKYWHFDRVYPQSKWGVDIFDINGNKLEQL